MTPADLVFRGGSIFTAGQSSSRAASVAIADGIIVAVGTDDDLAALVDSDTTVIDIAGRLLIPGFQDAHVHPIMGGIELLQCDLSSAEDADDCVRIIAEYAAANPHLPWIIGGGWSMEFFPGGTPTATLLDTAVSDRPAILMNRDHHGAWVNTAALQRAGITAETPDPADGRIERLADGSPSGTLHEGAFGLLDRYRPSVDEDFAYRGLIRAQQELLAFGITGWQDAFVGSGFGVPDTADVYRRALADDTLKVKVTGALWWERAEGMEQVAQLISRRDLMADSAPAARLTTGTVKIMVDGVAENFTAAMSTPYLDAHGHATDNAGLSFIDKDRLKEYVTALDAAGFQVHFHSLGDRAVTEALDALEAARKANGATGNRHHLAHIQVIDAPDIARFVALGASANMQPLWACVEQQLSELTFPFLDQKLIDQHYPFGSLHAAGVHLVAGSDWPVSSANPILGIHVAVNRAVPGSDEPPLGGAEQQLDLATALTAYTAGSAYINGRETTTGRIEVGFAADLAVLDRDPFQGPVADIHRATVVGTWIDGRPVFTA